MYWKIISSKTRGCLFDFYKNNKPLGKWTSYKPEGSLDEPEGLYEGPVGT